MRLVVVALRCEVEPLDERDEEENRASLGHTDAHSIVKDDEFAWGLQECMFNLLFGLLVRTELEDNQLWLLCPNEQILGRGLEAGDLVITRSKHHCCRCSGSVIENLDPVLVRLRIRIGNCNFVFAYFPHLGDFFGLVVRQMTTFLACICAFLFEKAVLCLCVALRGQLKA